MESVVADTWEKLGPPRNWTTTSFNRGDGGPWDLGMAAKVRPCVVVSVAKPDRQRNMSVVVPMTTEIRSGECEIRFPKPPWLRQESVVNVLGIAGVDNAKIERLTFRISRRQNVGNRIRIETLVRFMNSLKRCALA